MRKKNGLNWRKNVSARLGISLILLALYDGCTPKRPSPNCVNSQHLLMGRGGLAAAEMVRLFMGSFQWTAVSRQRSVKPRTVQFNYPPGEGNYLQAPAVGQRRFAAPAVRQPRFAPWGEWYPWSPNARDQGHPVPGKDWPSRRRPAVGQPRFAPWGEWYPTTCGGAAALRAIG
jgi:hypothetical protein